MVSEPTQPETLPNLEAEAFVLEGEQRFNPELDVSLG
jgi:hypothetical protein